jgi:hypothetical protein
MRFVRGTIVVLVLVTCAAAQQRSYPWVSSIPAQLSLPSPSNLAEWFDVDNAALYQAHAADLIRATMGSCLKAPSPGQLAQVQPCASGEHESFPGPKDYVLIHILKWKDLKPNAHSQAVDKQHWYVFHEGKPDWDDAAYASNNRIFGRRNVYFLYVHFNRSEQARYMARYTMTAKKKTPAYLDHFVGLLNLFGVNTTGGGAGTAIPNAVWGSTNFDTYYVPSDLTLLPEMLPLPSSAGSGTAALSVSANSVPPPTATPAPAPDATSVPAGAGSTTSSGSGLPAISNTVPSASTPNPPTPAASAQPASAPGSIDNTVALDTHTFDNEGLYHIDFSVAVPIKKISEISYVSTSNTLVPAKVDKQTTFAVFDYHIKAVDTKANLWDKFPYPLAGVVINSQPLHRVLIGIGYGPVLANFYAGLVLTTQSLPNGVSCGTIPTSQQTAAGLEKRTCPGFNMGLNVSVGAVLNSLKPKQNSSSSSSSSASTK